MRRVINVSAATTVLMASGRRCRAPATSPESHASLPIPGSRAHAACTPRRSEIRSPAMPIRGTKAWRPRGSPQELHHPPPLKIIGDHLGRTDMSARRAARSCQWRRCCPNAPPSPAPPLHIANQALCRASLPMTHAPLAPLPILAAAVTLTARARTSRGSEAPRQPAPDFLPRRSHYSFATIPATINVRRVRARNS